MSAVVKAVGNAVNFVADTVGDVVDNALKDPIGTVAKVAAVATLCQDERVYTAMSNAGTPCPIDGQIGASAQEIWEANPKRKPQKVKSTE